MKSFQFSLCILIVSLVIVKSEEQPTVHDYCGKGLCGGTDYKHITCDATGTFTSNCVNPSAPPLSQSDKDMIVDLHNQLRNKIAGGNENGFNPASRMTTMVWDEEMAVYAGLNVRRCKDEHDCHMTPSNKYSGQNINAIWHFGAGATFDNITTLIQKSVKKLWWDDEIAVASQENIDNCCGTNETPGHKINHFLQMAQEKANTVGCAISYYTDAAPPKGKYPPGPTSYIACNYAFGIIPNQKVYESGSPASKCKTGSNPNYPSLCSENESPDPNSPFSFE